MSRYRAPQIPGSQFITAEGFARLQAELSELWRTERPRVTQAVQDAAAQGDRSENAEYTYGKRRLREIDRRVRFLRKRLDGMTVVDRPPSDPTRVFFGAWVTLERDDGAQVRYRIVGPDETDAVSGYISMDSPLGRVLLGKALDAEVSVTLPAGSTTYTVIAVDYSGPTRSPGHS
jgi:transcription elongation factor GreB